ncbi:receptor expression-enhancing protein 4-like isoform X2 [Liolophura sinensis]
MMYWIIFALFTCVETFSDMFIAWIPFYYEIKIVFVLWLLSPVTKGSSFLYRKFVHPQFSKREKEIDDYIAKASDKGYTTLISLGSKGITYATNVVLQTAIKGQSKLADQIRRSYSMSDIASSGSGDAIEIIDDSPEFSEDELDNRIAEDNRELERKRDQVKRRKKIQRAASSAGPLYSLSEEESETSLTKETSTMHRGKHHESRYSTRSSYSTSEAVPLLTESIPQSLPVSKRYISTSVHTSTSKSVHTSTSSGVYKSTSASVYTSTSRLYTSSSTGNLSCLPDYSSSSSYSHGKYTTPGLLSIKSPRSTGYTYQSTEWSPSEYTSTPRSPSYQHFSKSLTSLGSYSAYPRSNLSPYSTYMYSLSRRHWRTNLN